MNMFQWIVIAILALILGFTIRTIAKGRIAPGPGLLWVALWLGAATTVASPSLTVVAARILGIGRGADFVFYCGLVVMTIGFFRVYVRMRKMDEEITRLVREIALLEASLRWEGGHEPGTVNE